MLELSSWLKYCTPEAQCSQKPLKDQKHKTIYLDLTFEVEYFLSATQCFVEAAPAKYIYTYLLQITK